jgi:hypothetical protein
MMNYNHIITNLNFDVHINILIVSDPIIRIFICTTGRVSPSLPSICNDFLPTTKSIRKTNRLCFGDLFNFVILILWTD